MFENDRLGFRDAGEDAAGVFPGRRSDARSAVIAAMGLAGFGEHIFAVLDGVIMPFDTQRAHQIARLGVPEFEEGDGVVEIFGIGGDHPERSHAAPQHDLAIGARHAGDAGRLEGGVGVLGRHDVVEQAHPRIPIGDGGGAVGHEQIAEIARTIGGEIGIEQAIGVERSEPVVNLGGGVRCVGNCAVAVFVDDVTGLDAGSRHEALNIVEPRGGEAIGAIFFIGAFEIGAPIGERHRRFHAPCVEPILAHGRQRAAFELVGNAIERALDIEQIPFPLGNDRRVRQDGRRIDDIVDLEDGALIDQIGDHRGIAIDEVVALAAGQRSEHHLVIAGLGLDHFDIEPEVLFELLDEQLVLGGVLAAGDRGEDAQILRHSGGGHQRRGQCDKRAGGQFRNHRFQSPLGS